MDITRSVSVAQRVAGGLRLFAWLVFIVFAALAINVAFKVSLLPVSLPTAAEAYLPATGLVLSVLLLVCGAVTWLLLLGIASMLDMLVVIATSGRATGSTKSESKQGATAGAR